MRVAFAQIFQQNPNGSISPRTAVQVGGVTMTQGVAFTAGVSFGGLDLAAIAGRDLEVEQNPGGPVIIKGHY